MWVCSGVHKPARLATVCKSWNQLLSAPSEVWHTVELTGSRAGATSAQQLEGSGLVAWLLQRRSAIRDITFKRMPVLFRHLHLSETIWCSVDLLQALESDRDVLLSYEFCQACSLGNEGRRTADLWFVHSLYCRLGTTR